MQRFIRIIVLLAAISLAVVAPARAQTSPGALGGCRVSEMQGATQEVASKEAQGRTEKILVLTGSGAVPVRVDCDDTQFFADFVEIHIDRNRVVATSNVLYVSSNSRISAERMEFDTKAKTGTFFNASGLASLGDRVDRSMFGTQEADAIFSGREIHKVGPKKYQIVDGAFSTCVQPTPRWQLVSGLATLNLDDYALLKNSVLRVKGVPLMYLPIFYYPIQEDDRATGFLIPTYGTSTFRGQSLSNAFFWAINRSQDATLVHDWFSKAGQQVGGEYRYVLGGGSQGNARLSLLDEKAQTTSGTVPTGGRRSYRIDGGMTQTLGGGWRARANANYFSKATPEQLYQQDVYRATQSTRSFGGNVTGNWREYLLSTTLDRTDYFDTTSGSTAITTNGGLPRVNFSRAERPIGTSPLYFGLNTDYATIVRSTARDGVTISDQGLTRLEVNPALRIPFTRWPFFTVNSTVAWRGTYWTESLDRGVQVPESLRRQYFDFNARITGPVFTRIFTPSNGDARKFKHVIEPNVGIQRVTPFDVNGRIVQLEGSDYVVPDTTRLSYGLTNRLYAKKETAREILSVSLSQSRYSNPRAAQLDQQYQNSFTRRASSKFTPAALVVRGSPTDRVQADFRTEWDPTARGFLSFAANGTVNTTHLQASGGWSQQRLSPERPGAPFVTSTHYLNGTATWRGVQNRIGATYAFNYDLRRDTFLQQRYITYYNAQCCGFAVEYQVFNFAALRAPQDRRFNVSFTLAGIGTFSNFLGAFGGQPGR